MLILFLLLTSIFHKEVGSPRLNKDRQHKCICWVLHQLIIDQVRLLMRQLLLQNVQVIAQNTCFELFFKANGLGKQPIVHPLAVKVLTNSLYEQFLLFHILLSLLLKVRLTVDSFEVSEQVNETHEWPPRPACAVRIKDGYILWQWIFILGLLIQNLNDARDSIFFSIVNLRALLDVVFSDGS